MCNSSKYLRLVLSLTSMLATVGAAAVTFTTDTSIGTTNNAYDGQDLVVTNCTVTIDGFHGFNSIWLQSGGVLTHSYVPSGSLPGIVNVAGETQTLSDTNPATLSLSGIFIDTIVVTDSSGTNFLGLGADYEITQTNGLVQLTRLPTATVPDGSAILVSYQALGMVASGLNLAISSDVAIDAGAAIDATARGFGPGFGPGAGQTAMTNIPYSFYAGSGGGHGGIGGPSVTRAVGGNSYDSLPNPVMNGSPGGLGLQPGGAGGGAVKLSIHGALRVDGALLANGADGLSAYAGGGSGGSLWITADTLSGSGALTANGGAGEPLYGGGGGGGRIAVYLGSNQLTNTNGFTGRLTAYGGAGFVKGGAGTIYRMTTSTPAQLLVDNGGSLGTNTPIPGINTVVVTISGGAIAYPTVSLTLSQLLVRSNAWLTYAGGAGQAPSINVSGDATFEAGGGIMADGKGYAAGAGPGAGHSITVTNSVTGSGGAHIGFGGASAGGVAGGTAYDYISQPSDSGSGGGSGGFPTGGGGAGGGLINLTVSGTLQLDGKFTANGLPGVASGSGGGGGGNIRLSVGKLAGAGSMSANGGTAELPFGGGGGGGSIWVQYTTTNAFTGSMMAQGGKGANNGGAGIILQQPLSGSVARVIVDNGGLASPTNTVLGSSGRNYDLTVSGGATAASQSTTQRIFANLLVRSNSVFTVTTSDTTTLTVQTNATVEAGGAISYDSKGSGPGSGVGAGRSINVSPWGYIGSGGGNGGYGGAGVTNTPGGAVPTSGSVTAPNQAGSGGGAGNGSSPYNLGGPGGGSIQMTVGRVLTIDGRISANGGAGVGQNSGGGSGGSIYLNANTITGSGSLSANGGSADLPYGGGGGGGRIAVYFNTNRFAGAITAQGGAGFNYGGPGTIYLQTNSLQGLPRGVLIVDNGGHSATNTPLPTLSTSTQLDLTVSGAAQLLVSQTPFPPVVNLLVASNSWLLYSNTSLANLQLGANNVTIQAGGGISADGMGNGAGKGSGQGALYGGGGGYGGLGGQGATNQVSSGGNSYGSLIQPNDLGSGGANGQYQTSLTGGAGGSAIKLTVTNRLQLDGRISANGALGLGQGSGGGSGGSLWLALGTLAGNGLISVKGGAGDFPAGGGGGGGRIAVYYTNNQFTGAMTAAGGSGAHSGGAGTIYLSPGEQLRLLPQIIVDNGGVTGMGTPILISNPSFIYELTVSGNASASMSSGTAFSFDNLLVGTNSSLTITNLSASPVALTVSNATVQPGGALSLDGTGAGPGTGQGPGRSASGPFGQTGGGGGYGGAGGSSLFGAQGGTAYGFVYIPAAQPNQVGSGGGIGSGNPTFGGAGGGALQLTVRRTLRVDGRLSADGAAGIGLASGGGSGGSLFLTVGTLSGGGLISANGGSGDLPYGGGGGGGRIAVLYGTNLFAGALSARGGPGGFFGGAGTIYLQTTLSGIAAIPQLTVDNGGFPGGWSNTVLTLSGDGYDLNILGGASASFPGLSASVRNLLIAPNSTLTLGALSSGPRTLTILGNANIQAGGVLSVDGLGAAAGAGSGGGRSASTSPFGTSGGGGGYGGFGSSSFFGSAGGNAYGSVTSPTDIGSGGGNGGGSSILFGGAGGGSLRLTVNGSLTLDGRISADGLLGQGQGSGGGSGGSLWITANNLFGAGTLSANGGSGDLPYGGGGGGGRIALYPTITNLFGGSFSARGGAGATYGGAGTIYLSTFRFPLKPLQQPTYVQVIADNGGNRGTNTSLGQVSLQVLFDLTVSGGAVLNSPASPGNLHNVLVASNSWIVQPAPQQSSILWTTMGDVTIQPTAAIRFDGAVPSNGVGAGAVASNTGGGGGYGGCGGSSILGALGGNAYGSVTQPNNVGSAGAAYFYNGNGIYTYTGGAGGGGLHLSVGGTLTVDGQISADGTASPTQAGGGGSGGSLWLSARTFTGAGVISADGGDGDFGQGGGGGGGRIAIYFTTNRYSGGVSAYSGLGAVVGGAGTIYTRPNFVSSYGSVLVDNGNLTGTNTPLATDEAFALSVVGGAIVSPSAALASASPPMVVRSLLVDSGAMLTHLSSQSNLDLTVLGDALIDTNGAMVVDNRGYNGNNGGPGAGAANNTPAGGGGGYGGAGGAGLGGVAGGAVYGSAQHPVDRGSRGGVYPIVSNFSEGGGAVRLRVGGTLSINGRVTANGDAALLEGAGGGAGGSIWITARQLAGGGLILANGGAGEPAQGGGGGGGRIAIYTRTNLFAGLVGAFGGPGVNPGGNGSVYYDAIPAPQVIAQVPADVAYSAVSFVDLTFDAPMDASSIPTAEVSLYTPDGLLPAGSLSSLALNLTTARVSFPAQSSIGYYELDAGPDFHDIYGQPMAAVYPASFLILAPTISGQVTDTNGAPVRFVTIKPDGGLLSVATDTNGMYAIEVPPSWAGTLTPSKGVSIFIPGLRSYTNVSADLPNQNFVMTTPSTLALAAHPQGQNMSLSWYGLKGVWYQVLCSSNLVDWVPYGSPIQGTNGPISYVCPVSANPQVFFRFSTAY